MTLATGLLIAFVVVAVVTDIRQHTIYNANTYPGILLAIAFHGAAAWLGGLDPNRGWPEWVGAIPLEDCLLGLAACGGCMLLCYVVFAGLGGGDVKLIAMAGAFLGLEQGILAMLWTFVLGGAMALIVVIWRAGLLTLLGTLARRIVWLVRTGRWVALSPEERRPWYIPVRLAPCLLAAVLLVRLRLVEGIF
jgi:prepilin peptidase CpaA